jgi:predicted ester cyclase
MNMPASEKHNVDRTYRFTGHAGVQRLLALVRKAFPDIKFTQVSESAPGEDPVTVWTARGTHTGAVEGHPPSGRKAVLTVVMREVKTPPARRSRGSKRAE